MNCTSIFFNGVTMGSAEKRANVLFAMWQGLLYLMFPKVCAGCGTDLPEANNLICLDCMEALPLTNFHMHENNPVENVFRGRLNITCASSYVYFTKQSVMQHILHQLKYKGNREVGYYFGRRMGNMLRLSKIYDDVQGLIPLPLFPAKERKRGYNQSTLICEGMAEIMKIPVLDKVIRRAAATETQTRKNRMQRWENIEGKFVVADKAGIEGKHVLLVDDVLTTGASLEA
ncbi:MAG: ComF family protein, partial [Chitinophagaceae bacterium]|nr:ComF family protein [Chitinophagaceae bacterium]